MALKIKSVTTYECDFLEKEEIVYYGPVKQKISFSTDPRKKNISAESLSKEAFGLYADSLEVNSIKESSTTNRVSKKNHYKMDITLLQHGYNMRITWVEHYNIMISYYKP